MSDEGAAVWTELMGFNVDMGFQEAVVRGYRGALLRASDYQNLGQCNTVDDMKMHLQATDYGNFLQNEQALTSNIINDRCMKRLVDDFQYLRVNANQPLATFLDYITYEYMIDNVILLINGLQKNRPLRDLLHKCHPLGLFDSIEAIVVADNPKDLYKLVLRDTPIGPYFFKCVSVDDMNELNIEVIRNLLYKAYIEDFYQFCQDIGGTTAEVMGRILRFEADRRAINITINSWGTDLKPDNRRMLMPTIGLLFPEGIQALVNANDRDDVHRVCLTNHTYKEVFSAAEANPDKSLDDCFMEASVYLNRLSFEQQFHFGVFYSWVKLREQEVKNLFWIASCVEQDRRDRIGNFVTIF